MADEENVDQEIEMAEETMEAEGSPVEPDEPTAEEPEAPAEAAADALAEEEPQAEAQPETSPEEEPASEPSSEVASDDSEAASGDSGAASDKQEVLPPKERRRRARQGRAPATRPTRTTEERQAERDALSVKNAKARAERRRKVRAKKPAASPTTPQPVVVAVVAGTQKTRQGIVVSDKAAKTITVRIDTSRRHRRYQKIVRSSKTLHAHDERGEAHEGDLVRVIETRPLSATKRWRLAEVLERAR
jgi:small subunit ribosomal protein S17